MENMSRTRNTTAAAKDWACQECGKRMTLRAAERAMSTGCTGCGGSDVDLAEPIARKARAVKREGVCELQRAGCTATVRGVVHRVGRLGLTSVCASCGLAEIKAHPKPAQVSA